MTKMNSVFYAMGVALSGFAPNEINRSMSEVGKFEVSADSLSAVVEWPGVFEGRVRLTVSAVDDTPSESAQEGTKERQRAEQDHNVAELQKPWPSVEV